MSDITAQIYFTDTKSKAVFSTEGPKPQFLIDTPKFKALVVGLEAGGKFPFTRARRLCIIFLKALA